VLIPDDQQVTFTPALDPFQVPSSERTLEQWRAIARKHEKRARRSHHLLLGMRDRIDALLASDGLPEPRRDQ
jgi:hypothetical protein